MVSTCLNNYECLWCPTPTKCAERRKDRNEDIADMRKRDPFHPVRAIVQRNWLQSGSVLARRECIVGHIPASAWARIGGRKALRRLTRVVTPQLWFTFDFR